MVDNETLVRKHHTELSIAARIALHQGDPLRRSLICARAYRGDGVAVQAVNGYPWGNGEPRSHAEARLSRKLGGQATVYVARVLRSGHWANARPCADCERVLRYRRVTVVYYTIADDEYGVIWL